MELRQLRYFISVAETRNVSAASRLLHVSQPPVTRQIRQLEAELGQVLFTRGVKGVELTPAGLAFLPEAKKVLSQMRLAVERSQAAGRGELGLLAIGYLGTSIYEVVPRILRRFRRETPGVTISLKHLTKQEQVESLREGRIDIGFARYYPYEAELATECVGHERLFFAAAVDSISPKQRAVALPDLKDERLVLFPSEGRPSFADEIIARFAKAGLAPHVSTFAEDVSAALALTAAGLGPTFVPESVTTLTWPGIVFLPVTGEETLVPINCIYLKDRVSPILDSLLRITRQVPHAYA
jgi:LysR family transcriptional regulator, benzoate and cis,cis-muconate-responsive activator of ben and cat genes